MIKVSICMAKDKLSYVISILNRFYPEPLIFNMLKEPRVSQKSFIWFWKQNICTGLIELVTSDWLVVPGMHGDRNELPDI